MGGTFGPIGLGLGAEESEEIDVDPDEFIAHESIEDDIELKMHHMGSKELWTQILSRLQLVQ